MRTLQRGAALLLLLLPAAVGTCDLAGAWTGGSGPGATAITVVDTAPGAFLASAQGAWQNASGTINNASEVALDCCEPAGLKGVVSEGCSVIQWDDPPRSVWTRPRRVNATVSNVAPRRDDTGEIMRVQDGCIANFKGVYYLYGARYQCCPVDEQPACYQPCGWRNATFAVYSSPDLTTWHLESASIMPIFDDATSPHSNTRNAYFEPCVLYSPSADHYALWFLSTNTKAVAVSDSPIGPFESVSWDTGLAQGSDAYYWVDYDSPEQHTYVKHNGPPPPGSNKGAHQVSRLAPDLLSVLPNASSAVMTVPALPVPPSYQGVWPTCSEGGGLFKAGGRWYVMAGACCCYCRDGANAYVWATADDNPLGVYTLQ